MRYCRSHEFNHIIWSIWIRTIPWKGHSECSWLGISWKSWRIEKWKIPNFDQNWPFKRELVTTKVVGGWYQYCLVYISSLFFDKLFFDNFWIAKCYSRRNQKHTRATSGYSIKDITVIKFNKRTLKLSNRSRVMWRYLCVICHIRKYKYHCWISPNLIHFYSHKLWLHRCWWQVWDAGHFPDPKILEWWPTLSHQHNNVTNITVTNLILKKWNFEMLTTLRYCWRFLRIQLLTEKWSSIFRELNFWFNFGSSIFVTRIVDITELVTNFED